MAIRIELTPRELERFWAKVDQEATPDGCWPWKGKLNAGARGQFTVRGHSDYAYRWMVRAQGVEITEGEVVRHLCDNPACVRPDHLAVGTQRDNNLDTAEHGHHRSAKLNATKARRIRERYAAHDRTAQRELAAEYGVTASAISEVIRGKTWPRAGGPVGRLLPRQ